MKYTGVLFRKDDRNSERAVWNLLEELGLDMTLAGHIQGYGIIWVKLANTTENTMKLLRANEFFLFSWNYEQYNDSDLAKNAEINNIEHQPF